MTKRYAPPTPPPQRRTFSKDIPRTSLSSLVRSDHAEMNRLHSPTTLMKRESTTTMDTTLARELTSQEKALLGKINAPGFRIDSGTQDDALRKREEAASYIKAAHLAPIKFGPPVARPDRSAAIAKMLADPSSVAELNADGTLNRERTMIKIAHALGGDLHGASAVYCRGEDQKPLTDTVTGKAIEPDAAFVKGTEREIAKLAKAMNAQGLSIADVLAKIK